MGKVSVFSGGIPTKPDVDKLFQELGVPTVGTIIPYERICEIIGQPKRSYRWSAVVTAWRKRMSQAHNVELGAVTNKGFEVLSNSGRVVKSVSQYKSGLKQFRRSGELAARTSREGLTVEERRAADHVVITTAALLLKAATDAKQLKYPEKE